MFQNGFNFQHLSSKEGLTIRARRVHAIWPSLCPILGRLEKLLLVSGTLGTEQNKSQKTTNLAVCRETALWVETTKLIRYFYFNFVLKILIVCKETQKEPTYSLNGLISAFPRKSQ